MTMRTLLRDKQACLACVEGSPAAVAVHNKPEWLSLFADCAVVEDPVGSRPQINLADDSGQSPLSQFYETFIAANDIRFDVDYDVVCAGAVVRDLDIEIRMSEKVKVRVPMHLLYELTTENGEVRIKRLAAHWELKPMLRQQMQYGLASAVAGVSSFWRMLRHMGLSGLSGFLQARETVGEAGKAKVEAFVSAFNQKQNRALERLFTDDGLLAWPYGHDARVAFWAMPPGTLRVEKLLSAGRVTTATVYYKEGEVEKRGVAIFHFDRRNLLIRNAQLYMELGD
ncbi:nuclear transport factor 2 family protein [Litorivivens sp.]|uniref:nuclear transport factor 2 family protein n=1 Tax=Litorivivens sp. TaxID=2020868 RepID=UPI003568D3C5